MLKKVKSLVVAEVVVNQLLNHERFDHSKIDGYIESYQNGREQGLLLWILGNNKTKDYAYYICQARRSDRICIYKGPKGPYQMQSISKEAYKHPNYFSYDDCDGAVEWLIKDLGMVE